MTHRLAEFHDLGNAQTPVLLLPGQFPSAFARMRFDAIEARLVSREELLDKRSGDLSKEEGALRTREDAVRAKEDTVAKKEGEISWYLTHWRTETAERVGNLFMQTWPGVNCNVVRSTGQVYGCLGCSAQCGRCARTIRRIMDEALEGAFAAADVVERVALHRRLADRLDKTNRRRSRVR